MKFDNIIIGGGLSGLVCGIESVRAGKKTAIVSAGQSALHFWSGSFEFLNKKSSHLSETIIEMIKVLPEGHPYRKIGEKRLERLLSRVKPLFAEAGIRIDGSLRRNHYRLTPLGLMKPAWLTLDDYMMVENPSDVIGKKYAIINIYSYIDFFPRFLSYGLKKLGAQCKEAVVNIPQLDILRKSTTEMRATNISRFLTEESVDLLASKINDIAAGCDAVIMPAVLGMYSDAPVRRLREGVDCPVFFMSTTPASVPGVRCQLSLRDRFTSMGGTFFQGDTVLKGDLKNGVLQRIYTENFGDMPLEANNFVISTGSFFGQGLVATIDRIYEPIFGLDLNVGKGRTEWYDKDVFASQPYMNYGVVTDTRFRPMKNGEVIKNLYATGALLGGFNALKEGSGAGITLATSLSAAEYITGGEDTLDKIVEP